MMISQSILPLLLLNSNSLLTEAFSVSPRHLSLRQAKAFATSSLLVKEEVNDIAKDFLIDGVIKRAFENVGPADVTPPLIKSRPPPSPTTSEKEMYTIKPEHQEKLNALKKAQEEFCCLTQEDADRIFNAISQEVNLQRLPLAKMAVEETGMGQLEDKVLKNGLAAELIHDRYEKAKTCGLIHEDLYHGMKTYAHPVGPVCALTPVTNPTSTVIAKALMMAKTRNAGIFLPHPGASDCSAEAVRICREAGEKVGAPSGWLQVVDHPKMVESNAIMRSDEVSGTYANFGNHCLLLIRIFRRLIDFIRTHLHNRFV